METSPTQPIVHIDEDAEGETPAPPPIAAGPSPRVPAPLPRQRTFGARHVRRLAKRVLLIAVLLGGAVAGWLGGIYAIPIIIGLYILCGVLDVIRHRPVYRSTIDRYFFGNGMLTWLLSPFNLLMDLISLPYRNKGIYNLGDLPMLHQREITEVIQAAKDADVIHQLQDKITDGRSMIFFKWYGKNLPVSVNVPAFHRKYATIRTIGISIFAKRESTSWHFGPLRATLRVLYNLRPTPDNAAFIQVGDVVHRWNNDPLFIFDDTLMHQSRNDTDAVRSCMFIDIVRPCAVRPLMNAIVAVLQLLLIRINRSFYKRWKMIK